MNWKITDGDFYVSRTFGKDTNSGSKDAPFATMRRGMKAIYDAGNVAGSKLVLEGGVVYDENIVTSNLGGDGYNPALRNGIYFICDGCKGIWKSDSLNIPRPVNGDTWSNFNLSFDNLTTIVTSNGVIFHVIYDNCTLVNVEYSGYYIGLNGYILYFNKCILINLTTRPGGTPPNYRIQLMGTHSIYRNLTLIGNPSTGTYLGMSSSYIESISYTTSFSYMSTFFNYCALPSSIAVSDSINKHINIESIEDCYFIDYLNNNYNMSSISPLLNAGKPNIYTGKPTNIGGTYLAESINGSDTSLTLTNVVVDGDGSFVLDGGSSIGIIESNIIDLGTVKSVVKLDLNAQFDFDTNGIPTAFIDKNHTIAKGTAQSGTGTSVILSATEILNSNDDYYNGMYLKIIAGTGNGQQILISDYVASTKTITLDEALSVDLDNTSQYMIVENKRISFDFEVKWSATDNTLSDMTNYRLMEMCDYLTYSDMINKYGNADPNYIHANRNYVSARYIQFRITMKRIE